MTPEEFAERMAQETDQHLLGMLARPGDWLPQALDAARAELQKRNIVPPSAPTPAPEPAETTLPPEPPPVEPRGPCLGCRHDGPMRLIVSDRLRRHIGELFLCDACIRSSVRQQNRKRLAAYGLSVMLFVILWLVLRIKATWTETGGLAIMYASTIALFALNALWVIRFWPPVLFAGKRHASEFAKGLFADGLTDGGSRRMSSRQIRGEGAIAMALSVVGYAVVALTLGRGLHYQMSTHSYVGNHVLFVVAWSFMMLALFITGLIQVITAKRSEGCALVVPHSIVSRWR